MRPARVVVLLCLLPAALACRAELPGFEELQRSVDALAAQAADQGLSLRLGASWLSALRQRTPLVARHSRGQCQIGYTAYTPGRDYAWLFPALPPAQRRLWLDGVVQHELAHCAEQAEAAGAAGRALAGTGGADGGADGGDGAGPPGRTDPRWHEVLADLAFALHLDRAGAPGEALVRTLAALRAAQGATDPAHDSSRELACYLQQRRGLDLDGPWLATLRTLRARCWQPAG